MKFPFDDKPNTVVIICDHILNEKEPILFVSHDEDGMWQFLCGKSHTTADAGIISLEEVYALDSSIKGIAHMPCGYYATRISKDDDWDIKGS